jgi:hypothetical protein
VRRPVRVKRSFFIPFVNVFRFSQGASVAFLPSALSCERFVARCQLGYSFQQVLQPDNRPLLPSLGGKLGQDLGAVT